MIETISHKLFVALAKKTNISPREKETILYGINALTYTLISTLLLISFGAYTNKLLSTTIIIAVFYVNQTIGGGYHASSHLRCFLTMFVGLFLALFILNNKRINFMVYVIYVVTGATLMILIPVVLNKNKEYLEHKIKKMALCSRTCTITELLIGFVLFYFDINIFRTYSTTLLLSGLSRVTGHIIKKRAAMRLISHQET